MLISIRQNYNHSRASNNSIEQLHFRKNQNSINQIELRVHPITREFGAKIERQAGGITEKHNLSRRAFLERIESAEIR